jgi:hypothetical protein
MPDNSLLKEQQDMLSVEISTLRNEIDSLKKCQVDFIKLATILFGLTVTVVASITPHIQNIQSLSIPNFPFRNISLLIYILLLSFISLCYPYIMWIIIHKSRSIFRIIAYIRFIEQSISSINEIHYKYQGYETLHRKLKENKWLSSRIKDFNKYFPRIFSEFITYRQKQKKADDSSFEDNFLYTSCDGIEKSNEPYIGNYYGRLLFYLQLIWGINSFILIIITSYGLVCLQKGSLLESYFYIFVTTFFILWTVYHLVVTKRQLNEIRYRPFSIDAHFDMWKWASDEIRKL